MDREEVGKRLLQLRTEKGLYQHQVGEVIGVSKPSIGAYERGERIPRDDVKIKLAEFYGVDLAELFYKKS